MSKKITLIISLFFFATVFSAFQIGTLVYTPYGKKAIEQLQVGGELVSYQDGLLVFKKVIHKCVREEKESVSFVVGGETFVTSHDQKWYLSYKKVWKKACELNVGDVLCTQANNACTIDSLEFIDHRIEMVEITVQDTHTFFVGKQGILAHNVAPIVIGFSWAFGSGAIEFLGASFGIGILGKLLSLKMSKKKHDDEDDYRYSINFENNDSEKNGNEGINDEDENKHSGVKEKIKKLPTGGSYPFVGKMTKDGKVPRDRNGGFIDKNGNSWIWDPKKNEWDVQLSGGRRHRNVNKHGEITH